MLNDQPHRNDRAHNGALRESVPQCWLMTDARLGPAMLRAIAAMPPRSAVVVRHHALGPEGVGQVRAIRRMARARRHLLLTNGRSSGGFDGRHGSGGSLYQVGHRRAPGWLSMPVHNRREAARARTVRADAVLISPVHMTRSHPGQVGIGHARLAQLAAQAGRPAIALGGMTAARFRGARRFGAVGWAAIDAWLLSGPA